MRALVVEDEKTPRELLRDMVPWSRYGFDRVDTARNGLEALEVLNTEGADLVLTDVRMPKMDGVGLALEVRRRWPDCVLIFLSGFSDKEYLKTAIRVQAQDYLDKPIDLSLVEASIAEASRTLGQRREASLTLTPLRRQADALALFGRASGVIPELFATGPLRAFVIAPVGAESPGWKPAVLALINGSSLWPDFVAAPQQTGLVSVAAGGTLGADPQAFNNAIEDLRERLRGLEGADSRLGVAPAVPSHGGLTAALLEAQASLTEAFYRPSEGIYTYRPPSGRGLDLPEETIAVWRALMLAQDYAAVSRQLDLLERRSLTVRDLHRERVQNVWLQAVEELLNFVPAWGGSERASRLEKLGREMASATDLAELAAFARECFERLFVLKPGDLHVGDRIHKAQTYIEDRFADPDLTVDAIASHAGFSESYFCTVFKQSQNITVKDFVTRHRIDRAKAYLWEKDPPTLADLALKVGFRDPNYFSTVFKRLTGTTPGAYRKKALG